MLLYLALREAAHQRLFAHVPWLREHLIAAVADYGRGIDHRHLRASSRGDARHRPDQPRGDPGGAARAACSSREQTPAQQAALERLETTLALVEGWVDEVVGQATAERMPAAAKLQEAVRRRRAAGGPAEETFAALVGLELRPRRLRDASTLWGSLRSRQGTEARDARLDAPRPAAHRRRPRRPAGLPRGLPRRPRRSATTTSTPRCADLLDERARRRRPTAADGEPDDA